MRFLKNQQTRSKKLLSPEEKVKLAILSNRLNVTRDEASRLLQDIHNEVAETMGISGSVIEIDTEFAGRDLDLTLTINKQNTPKKIK